MLYSNCELPTGSTLTDFPYVKTYLNGKSTNTPRVERICSQNWMPFEALDPTSSAICACFELTRRPQASYFLPFLKGRGTIIMYASYHNPRRPRGY